MIIQTLSLALVALLGIVALVCYCISKKDGFGPYNTSVLVIILVLTIAGILSIGGYLDKQSTTNIFMAVTGFIVGIFVRDRNAPQQNGETNKPKKKKRKSS